MNRIDRLFGIITLLQSRKYVSADQLADRFDISVRTVYRDIKALIEQGIPVSFEAQRGYFLVQGFFLPPIAFTNEEANALLLVEQVAQGFTDQSVGKHYVAAIQKVRAVLKYTQKETAGKLEDKIHLQLPKNFINPTAHLSTIQEAIAAHHIVRIAYKNNKGEASERMIEPIGIVFYAFSWHVLAWCQLRQDYRDFKLSSIGKASNTLQPFSRAQHRSFSELIQELPVDY